MKKLFMIIGLFTLFSGAAHAHVSCTYDLVDYSGYPLDSRTAIGFDYSQACFFASNDCVSLGRYAYGSEPGLHCVARIQRRFPRYYPRYNHYPRYTNFYNWYVNRHPRYYRRHHYDYRRPHRGRHYRNHHRHNRYCRH